MKQTIQGYLANSDIEAAIAEMREYAQTEKEKEMQNDLILLNARYSVVLRQEQANTHNPEELQRERNRIIDTLLEMTDTLPNDPKDAKGKTIIKVPGISEKSMKQQLFFLILAIKVGIILWLVFHYSTDGIDSKEFAAGFGLLLPVFASYSGLMFQDFLAQRHLLPTSRSPQVKRNVQWTIYAILFAYAFSLFFVVYLRTSRGTISLTTGFTAIETLFGAYLSRIVATFFQRREGGL